MRHRKKFNHLSRKAPHRKAMLANMASSLIIHKRITTTTAKAKALRTFVEPVITRSKEDSTHSRRMVFKQLRDKNAVTELFREVAEKVTDRPGGYTRIIKLGNRLGDNADMCIIELVDYNENMLAEKAAAKPKSTRRRRGGGSKKATEDTDVATAEVAEAEVAEEAPAAEIAGEAPAAEAVEEAPAAEAVEEAPAAEIAEEAPAAEETKEEPKAEAAPEEEKKDEASEEEEKKEE